MAADQPAEGKPGEVECLARLDLLVLDGPKRSATSGVCRPSPNDPSIAASSTKTASCVKDGPPLVPVVKPTTLNRSGPVPVINWIC